MRRFFSSVLVKVSRCCQGRAMPGHPEGGSMHRRRVSLLGVACLALLALSAARLKAQLNRGIIEGVVTDPQGGVVPNVDVRITAVDTNVSLPTKTNSAGYYRVTDLVPGRYRARFEAGGFSPMDLTEIPVLAGQVIRVDVQ